MIPWYWNWSPIIKLPLSGAVEQDISPSTHWFFDSIPAQAGNGALEKEIFLKASYGKQLDLITEVLLSMHSRDSSVKDEKAKRAFDELDRLYCEINQLKSEYKEREHIQLFEKLRELKKNKPEEFSALLEQLDA